jgi:hypothetical protein
VSGALRQGIYTDSDRTQVLRSLATVDAGLSSWHLSAKESVDIVSSASLDVRSSPALDAMSSASSLAMSDRRFETTLGIGFDDTRGHSLSLSLVHALERDYTSVGAGLSGALDVNGRNTTLMGSFGANHNSISSIIDPGFARTMDALSYSAGIAQVLGQSDALRLRYDGQYMSGYQASPYRTVRFGDWTVSTARARRDDDGEGGGGAMVFADTIGPVGGLAEKVPDLRVRHAAVLEWLHALGDGVGVLASARLARDSWGIDGATVGADLRLGNEDWLVCLGYHFYLQTAASFFQDKYVMASDSYAYYTSDKELGEQRGHIASVDLRFTLRGWPSPGTKSYLDLQVDGLHYDYPGFTLLPSRNSLFAAIGLRIGF